MRGKGKAASFDIAYRAGVSQPTVSRALRGSRTVSEQTRQRILQIASELHQSQPDHGKSHHSCTARHPAIDAGRLRPG